MGEVKTDIKWIIQALKDAKGNYAPMWVKYPVYAGTGAMLIWTFNQILSLIPAVKALF